MFELAGILSLFVPGVENEVSYRGRPGEIHQGHELPLAVSGNSVSGARLSRCDVGSPRDGPDGYV